MYGFIHNCGGIPALAVSLSFFGHTTFYLAVFSLITLRKLLFLTPAIALLQWGIVGFLDQDAGVHLSGSMVNIVTSPLLAAVLPIGIAAAMGAAETAAVFDFIPTVIATIVSFVLAFSDQMVACSLTNIFYNRAVWWIEWNSFQGLVRFWPMLFCADDRAGSNSPAHHDYLKQKCIQDLGGFKDAVESFCQDVTGPSNTYRLMAEYNPCVSIGHVFFIGLIFACLYHAMHKLQKQAIIHITSTVGLYLLQDSIDKFDYFNLLTGGLYGFAVIFQSQVTSRITRSLGLDLSPPDQIPLSFAEAWFSLYSGIRMVVLSMHRGIGIVLIAWGASYAMKASGGHMSTVPFPCQA